jgi:hypothetical protein
MDNAQAAMLVNVTNSQGWALILHLANQIITASERAAIDCEDESKVVGLAREAKASRKFFDALTETIDRMKTPEVTGEDEFIPVSY